MTDAALVGRLLDEYHERSVPPADIHLAAGSEHESRVTYVLTLPDGSGQVIRAFRADALVPVHGRDSRNLTVADWLIGRAHTLAWLEAAAYPAPRPVRTRTGELVGVAGPWLTWATSYVAGDLLLPTLSQLRSLGVTLGRLHQVAPWPALPSGRSGKADLASLHPAVAGQTAMARLDAVNGRVPAAWQPLYAACRETVETVLSAGGSWAEAVVHGDVWARNAVQADGGPVALIDWEASGLGLAVIDLGSCLLECHLDAAVPDHQPDAWLISPDEDRIREVAAGYASVRRLSAAELTLLPAAVKFATAVVGSVHFELALLSGVSGPAMDARLLRLENRMAVADEVAELALEHLVPLCGTHAARQTLRDGANRGGAVRLGAALGRPRARAHSSAVEHSPYSGAKPKVSALSGQIVPLVGKYGNQRVPYDVRHKHDILKVREPRPGPAERGRRRGPPERGWWGGL